ncbi:MAG: bifunctional precorrin-2 dehydrogenase/sirohydrochlorin ferrochelatase [Caldimicrobium sp.]|nr:bifunctional precorrin-2 dehydrogenase/sirohydrochlorin ferrochelatase [Caldimicrobium sp.]
MTEYYPIFLKLKDKLCVVIGGGQVAERKILSLLSCQAQIRVISPNLTPKLRDLAERKKIDWESRPYQEGDLEGAFIVIAATNDPEVQERIFQEAEKRGIPCNIVDKPSLSSFIVPSTIKRGNFVLAISTGGASPALARRLREILEREFEEEFEIYVRLMGKIRESLLRMPLDPAEKEVKIQRLALAPLWQYIKRGYWHLIEVILERENLKEIIPEIVSFCRVSKDIKKQG